MAIQIQGFSLKTLNQKLKEAENARIVGADEDADEPGEFEPVTITVRFESPKSFEHEWTITDVSSTAELSEEVDTTEEVAKERLMENWFGTDQSNRAWQEIKETLTLDEPEQLKQFRSLKQVEDDLEDARDKTRSVYDRVDLSRTMKIQNKLSTSDNLKTYMESLNKVDETLDFEENVNIGTEDSAFQKGRQRTSGDVEWYNVEGERVRTLIFSNQVIFQIGGPQGEQIEFDDKEEALEYYRNNRIA